MGFEALPPNVSGPGRRGWMAREYLDVWRKLQRVHAQTDRRLESDLLAEHELQAASYDVLLQLVEAPGRRLRMADLAAHGLLSRSGVTRLVDRLESRGLVKREACEDDGRGLFAVLTPQGYERARLAYRTQLNGVRAYLGERLSEDELQQLNQLLGKLLEP